MTFELNHSAAVLWGLRPHCGALSYLTIPFASAHQQLTAHSEHSKVVCGFSNRLYQTAATKKANRQVMAAEMGALVCRAELKTMEKNVGGAVPSTLSEPICGGP